jgi:hypothetical protein
MPHHLSIAVRAAVLGVLVAAFPAGAAHAADASIGSITIVKQSDPAGDPAPFTFHFSGKNFEGTTYDEDFTLHDGESKTFDTGAGADWPQYSFVITERSQDGWQLVAIDCVANNNDGGWTTDLANATVSIELSPEESKTCTYSNARVATPLVPPADTPPAIVPPADAPPAVIPPAVGVLPEVAQPASARLDVPGRCVSRSYSVSVSASPVESVTFYRDNRKVRTVRAAPGQRRFTLKLPKVTATVDAIRARIVFRPGATLRTHTLHAVVRRCAAAVVRPEFTG